MPYCFLFALILLHSLVKSAEELDKAFQLVTYGSSVKLLHGQSKYRLHSHEISWGSGSGQQSITAVMDDGDTNSMWTVLPSLESQQQPSGTPIQCGDIIRLKHARTGKYLHSHLHTSPLSHSQEVSCFPGSDTGNNWELICSGKFWNRGSSIELLHVDTSQWLSTAKRFEFNQRNCRNCPIQGQLEVHCASKKSVNTYWSTAEGIYFPVPDDFDVSTI